MNVGDLFRYSGTDHLVVIIEREKNKRVRTGWVSVQIIATSEKCRVPKSELKEI